MILGVYFHLRYSVAENFLFLISSPIAQWSWSSSDYSKSSLISSFWNDIRSPTISHNQSKTANNWCQLLGSPMDLNKVIWRGKGHPNYFILLMISSSERSSWVIEGSKALNICSNT